MTMSDPSRHSAGALVRGTHENGLDPGFLVERGRHMPKIDVLGRARARYGHPVYDAKVIVA